MTQTEADNRLLIIDDDAAIRRTMTVIAESSGFAVKATDDPEVFKELLAAWRPSLVILDLQMPQRDGIQLLGDLGALRCEAQLLLATGADSRILDAATRLGREVGLKMAGTLRKPFELATVRGLLDRFRVLPAPSQEELAEAIEGDRLFLEYQPKLDCGRGRITGVEALVRWQHPSRGRLAPDLFIPLAERSDLISPLSNWVFARALNQTAAWHGAGIPIDVAINVSARDLDDPDLPDRLAGHCSRLALDPDSVILEITESSAMNHPVRTLEVLTRLRVKGFRLSMDDFGTAYSSLVQLQRLPFSELKIDRSFVTNLTLDESCRVIARIVVDLAHNLGLKSVAEGVESEETLRALQAMGCDSAQGYHLGRPSAADRIAAMIESGRQSTVLSLA